MTALLAGVAALALVVSGVPAIAVARFGLLVVFGFCLPGSLLTPRGLGRHEAAAVTLSLGIALAGVLWVAALWLGAPRWLPLACLAALSMVALVRGSWRMPAGSSGGMAALLFACTLSVAWTQFGDGRFTPQGGLRFTAPHASDALFHSAIAQQLRHRWPIEMPAGEHLPYHVAYDVLAALTAETSGAGMLDVHYRLLPVLIVPLAVVCAVAFGEAVGAAPAAAMAGALVLFFADDLSWLFAVFGGVDPALSGGKSWDLILGAPLLYAIHHNRGLLLGVALLFPALLLAGRYLRDGGAHALVVSALLLAVLFECKVTFFVGVLPAVALVAASGALREADDRRLILLARGVALVFVASALVVPVVLPMLGAGRAGQAPLEWAPGETGVVPLIRLGLLAGDPVHGIPAGKVGPFQALCGLALFVLGSLGIRVFGFVALRAPIRRLDLRARLAGSAAFCSAAAAAFLVTPPARTNTIYFWATSLAVFAVLAGIGLSDALGRMAPRRRLITLSLIGLLTLPGTFQLLWVERSVRARTALKTPGGIEQIARRLEEESSPGDVLLEPVSEISFLAALVPVTPVIAWPLWIGNTLGPDRVEARLDDSRTFFSATDPARRAAILDRYDVRWVWAPRGSECPPHPRLTLRAESPAGQLFSAAGGSAEAANPES